MCLPAAAYATATEPMQSHLNVGTGTDVTIRELAELVKELVGFDGELRFNTDYPDGTPRKLLDVSKLAGLGWRAGIDLRAGIEQAYRWYLENADA